MEKGTGRNYTGIVMAVIILVIMGLSASIALNVPMSKSFNLPAVPSGGPENQVNITLWADAAGWNFNHAPVNPVIVIPPKTLIHFTVIEEDNQPHTLTFAPGSQEASAHATILSTSDITTTPGHVSHASAYFSATGEYTYWCLIHPATMVGKLYVNASAPLPGNTTPVQKTYQHYYNTTMDLNNSALQSANVSYPTLYIRNDTFLNMTVRNNINTPPPVYSLNFSYGEGVNLSNSTTLINSTNRTAAGGFYFVKPGVYSYWNYYNRTDYGLIDVYTSTASTTLYANVNGWNYTKGTVNPTLSFNQFSLVTITMVNGDNLSHALIINPGTSENSSYAPIANVTPGVSNTTVVVFFYESGNYTYWDMYHPSTSVGLIRIAGNSSASGGILYHPSGLENGNSDISVIDTLSSHYLGVRTEN